MSDCSERQDDDPVTLWTAALQGRRLDVHCNRSRPTPKRTKARGCINSFSRKSRLRLLKNLATFDWEDIGNSSFITLTYPDPCCHMDPAKRNRERYLFHRYLEEHTGKHLAGVWRTEWIDRKSGRNKGIILPHIHLLAFGLSGVKKHTIRRWWKNIVSHPGYVDVDVEEVPSGNLCAFYVAKYCGKEQLPLRLGNVPYLNTTGRHYGYFRSREIPRHAEVEIPLNTSEIVHLLRVKAGLVLPYLDLRKAESFTLLGDYAVELAEEILAKGVDT